MVAHTPAKSVVHTRSQQLRGGSAWAEVCACVCVWGGHCTGQALEDNKHAVMDVARTGPTHTRKAGHVRGGGGGRGTNWTRGDGLSS